MMSVQAKAGCPGISPRWEWSRAPSPSPVNLGRFTGPPSFPGPMSGSPRKAADTLLTFLFYGVNPFLSSPSGRLPVCSPHPLFRVTPYIGAGVGSIGGTLCLTHPSSLGGHSGFVKVACPTLLFQQLSPDS